MIDRVNRISSIVSPGPRGLPARGNPPMPGDEPLDQVAGFLGMGRSQSFPFPQWRAADPQRTVYFDVGKGPRTIVLVHGLGANATHFEQIMRPMASRHRMVGLDLLGCGWSEKPRVTYTLDLLRDHLLSFLDRRGIGRATLVGHSMGGAVCLSAALKRPGQFDGLGLLCAAGVGPLPAWMRRSAPLFLRQSLLLPTLALGHNFIVKNVFATREIENPNITWFRDAFVRDAPGYPNFRHFVRVCETLCRDVARQDFSPRFKDLHLPVLALYGDHDKLSALPSVMRSLDGIRRIRTVLLKDCGHMPMIEWPEETVFHLERFLENPPK